MRRSRPIAVVTWVWSSFLIKQKHLRFDLRKGEFLKCCFLFFLYLKFSFNFSEFSLRKVYFIREEQNLVGDL